MSGELVKSGKVKEVYDAGEFALEFRFSDNISVFDKVIPSAIPDKGEVLCRIGEHWFEVLEAMGIRTHFIERTGSNSMKVRKVRTIYDYGQIGHDTVNYLIPLEFICRHFVAGSLHERFKKGRVKPEDVGFPADHVPKYGERLPEPFFEMTTKLEEVDRHLTDADALEMAGLTMDDYEHIRETVLAIDGRMSRDVEARGLLHVDGKKEFAYDGERRLMVIDTFGTPDEDRWWDIEAYNEGRFVELSKEAVRQHYKVTGYYDILQTAREAGQPEPPIPALPDDKITEVSELYKLLFKRITGKDF